MGFSEFNFILARRGLVTTLAVLSAVTALEVHGVTPTVEFRSLRFFEGPFERPSEPQYERIFGRSDTRYIWCNVHVGNLRHNRGSNPVSFRLRYFNPDGSFKGESSINFTIPADWSSAYLYGGYGYRNTGNWPPGEYRVEAYFYHEDGDYDSFDRRYELLRTAYFLISDNPRNASLDPDPTISIHRMRFFEAGASAPPRSERVYQTEFPLSEARTIWTELESINHLHEVRRNQPKLELDYFNPDGSRRGTSTLNMNADPGWRRFISTTGWGWTESRGNWPAGDYRVVVREGQRILASGEYSIVDDRPLSFAYKAVNVRFHGGSGTPSATPAYAIEFASTENKVIHVDFAVQNPNHGVRPHEAEFAVDFFRVEADREIALRHRTIMREFRPQDREVALSASMGEARAGNWDEGRYGVRIWMGDELLNLAYFRIY